MFRLLVVVYCGVPGPPHVCVLVDKFTHINLPCLVYWYIGCLVWTSVYGLVRGGFCWRPHFPGMRQHGWIDSNSWWNSWSFPYTSCGLLMAGKWGDPTCSYNYNIIKTKGFILHIWYHNCQASYYNMHQNTWTVRQKEKFKVLCNW